MFNKAKMLNKINIFDTSIINELDKGRDNILNHLISNKKNI